MSTYLLALDYIAPMIGGSVIAGTVSFLGGVLLARRQMAQLGIKHRHQYAPLLEAEIERLNIERQQSELEDEIIGDFSSQRTISAALWGLVSHVVANRPSSFAAVICGQGRSDRPLVSRGLSEQSVARLKLTQQLLPRLKTQNPLLVHRNNDPTGLFECLDESDRQKTSTLYLTALDDGRDLFGVLLTSDPWPEGLPQAEQHLFMKRLARRIGKRCHLVHLVEQQTNELWLSQQMLELRAIVDVPHVQPLDTLMQFVQRLQGSMQADRVAVYFAARRQGERLQPVAQCGDPLASEEASVWLQQEQALARAAIDAGTASVQQERRVDPLDNSTMTVSAAMPIRVNGHVLGALCFTSRKADVSPQNRRTLIEFGAETLSRTFGRAFEDASIRRQARRDHLTDLANRRSFDAYLAMVIERIHLREVPGCSLIFADLDHFKSINDRYGHQMGDQVLRITARVLSEQIAKLRMGERSLVVRYGGEEFAILLPGVELAEALRISEAIRSAIEATVMTFKETRLNVTISLGVAVCPDEASSVDALVAAADKALYEAKAQGRNRVCHLEPVVH